MVPTGLRAPMYVMYVLDTAAVCGCLQLSAIMVAVSWLPVSWILGWWSWVQWTPYGSPERDGVLCLGTKKGWG